MASFVLSFFPLDVLDETWDLIESVSEGFLTYSFKFLGAVVSDDGSKPEVLSRIAQATAALTKLKPIWRDNNISLGSKVTLMRSLVISIFLYACES